MKFKQYITESMDKEQFNKIAQMLIGKKNLDELKTKFKEYWEWPWDWAKDLPDNGTGEYKWEAYLNDIVNLHLKGGYVYRIMFMESIDDIDTTDLGMHWTSSAKNLKDYAENLNMTFNKHNQNSYVLEARVGPKNIDAKNADLGADPGERELTIKNPKAIKTLHIYELDYKKGLGKLLKRVK
jgi:hypothetical protein